MKSALTFAAIDGDVGLNAKGFLETQLIKFAVSSRPCENGLELA
jgi:hypothetical protein